MLINLIDEYDVLTSLARKAYLDIEIFYSYNDAGRKYNCPMNVNAGTIGGSARPHQTNAFYTAEAYRNASNIEMLDLRKIQKSINHFSKFLDFIDEHGEEKVIPSQFVPTMRTFLEKLTQFSQRVAGYKETPSGLEIDLRAIFRRQIAFLLKHEGFCPQLMQKVRGEITARKDATNEQIAVYSDLNLEKIVEITQSFNSAPRFYELMEQEDLPEKVIREYFENLHPSLIDVFIDLFVEEHHEKMFREAIQNISSAWNPKISFFSEGQLEHSQKFEPTLKSIKSALN